MTDAADGPRMTPDRPLVKALGAQTGRALLAKLGLSTVGDLLRHYPFRYAERGALTPLQDLRPGEHVTISARVLAVGTRRTAGGKWLTEVKVTDGRATVGLAFFAARERLATWQAAKTPVGAEGLFAGTVNVFRDELQLLHPEVFLDSAADAVAGGLIPVYPAAAGMPSWNIGRCVDTVLPVVDLGPDPLPAGLRREYGLLPLREAMQRIHRPAGHADVELAARRLRWDEAIVLQVTLAQRRLLVQQTGSTPRPGRTGGLLDAFDAALPFALTGGQRDIGEVLADELGRGHPMHRLLQGEVGSGKTLVAVRAALRVVDSGGQAAVLAPTEVLAQQHARSLAALLGPLGTAGELGCPPVATRVALLTGSLGAAARRAALAATASGEAGIVVGTHALLGEGVAFADLGLVVVDEQHRFGVEQREALRAKGDAPHVLVMTATPIPRTVAMTVYGDLEVSTLRELPAGRAPITTHVVPTGGAAFDRVWARVREEVARGRQAFVVCPRIGPQDGVTEDDGEERPPLDGRRPGAAVVEVVPALSQGALRGLRVDALHGRLAAEAKDAVMGRFVRGELDVLVATTVIEVGVDVPNATVMVVLDPDRFGISQLHQLRGRIGRGGHPGLCLLVTDVGRDSPAGERLAAVEGTTDGFELSRVDLQLRREGDVLGAAQSGTRSSLRMLQLLRDADVIVAARAAAVSLVGEDPELDRHPALRAALGQVLDAERSGFLERA